MTPVVAVVGSPSGVARSLAFGRNQHRPGKLQQSDRDPGEHANNSPRRDRQHWEHGAASTHPRRSRTIGNATSRHGVLHADPRPPKQRTAALGEGGGQVERPAAGRGDTNLRRLSTPAGGRVMTKSQHAPWRNADPLSELCVRLPPRVDANIHAGWWCTRRCNSRPRSGGMMLLRGGVIVGHKRGLPYRGSRGAAGDVCGGGLRGCPSVCVY